MIGSRHKNSILFEELRKEGFTQEELDRVYTPIGLSIKSETPEEISVSIAAEMIQVRAKHNEAAATARHAEELRKLHE